MGRITNKLRHARYELAARLHRAPKNAHIVCIDPGYWLVDRLHADSVIVDMGLGNNADFSMAMIDRFDLTSHGFDPTRRHVPALKAQADTSGGRFFYYEKAIGAERGSVTFFESKENVSGSTITGHHNITHDTIEQYSVEVITVADALRVAGSDVSVVKMDIEGAEEAVLDGCSDELLLSIDQWCIEFHHATVAGISFRDTRQYINRFVEIGFRMYSRNSVEFLFYRP